MELRDIQGVMKAFIHERKWDEFPPELVYTHLTEELGEIARYILFSSGYKKKELGHPHEPESIAREFAQVFNLFLQLANHFNIDLQESWENELKIMKQRFSSEAWKEYMKTRDLDTE